MKKVTVIALMLLSFSLRAQKDSLGMPVLNGMVGIQKVAQLDSVTSKDIYQRAKLYFAEAYKSAKDVIQLDDAEQGIIVGKALTQVSLKNFAGSSSMDIWFTLKIECKESRYRYTIDGILTTEYKQPAEAWWKYPKLSNTTRIGIGEQLNSVAKNLEISMSKPSIKKEDKW